MLAGLGGNAGLAQMMQGLGSLGGVGGIPGLGGDEGDDSDDGAEAAPRSCACAGTADSAAECSTARGAGRLTGRLALRGGASPLHPGSFFHADVPELVDGANFDQA